MKLFGWCLLLLTIALVGLFAWTHGEARADPIVRTARIGFHAWPAGAPAMRVLLASDIHLGNEAMDVPRLTRIVGQIDALKPDVILLAGDFVAGHDPHVARTVAQAMIAPLSGLHARDGVIAVLGNHDEDTDPALITRALARAGIQVVRNDAVRAGAVTVAGIGDLTTHNQDTGRAVAAAQALRGVPIAVAHSDVRFFLRGKIRLLLLGHTHCGQIALGSYGVHNPYMSRVHSCGLARDKDGITVTTAGLGTSVLPLRLNAPPDMWLLTLGPVTR